MEHRMLLCRVEGKIPLGSQVAVHLALEGVKRTAETTLTEGQRLEAELFGRCCDSEDFRKGVKALLTKRKPLFKGR
jgi:2-(1,2-epoxy-1,2-dihydrophenyl)acetyl-CoA isomerase